MKTRPNQTTHRTPVRAPATITVEEQRKLLEALFYAPSLRQPKEVRYRNHGMALLMLDAGLRVGEVTRLLVTDLLIRDEPVLALHLCAAHTKNHSERTVPLSMRIVEAIKSMRDYVWHIHENAPGSFAFYASWPQRPLSTRQVERIIKRAAITSIGRSIHPHVLRHTFASKMMRVTNARIVQELLGHKSITTTQVYTHPNNDDMTEAIKSAESREK